MEKNIPPFFKKQMTRRTFLTLGILPINDLQPRPQTNPDILRRIENLEAGHQALSIKDIVQEAQLDVHQATLNGHEDRLRLLTRIFQLFNKSQQLDSQRISLLQQLVNSLQKDVQALADGQPLPQPPPRPDHSSPQQASHTESNPNS